jgi:ERCC4-type nuclease
MIGSSRKIYYLYECNKCKYTGVSNENAYRCFKCRSSIERVREATDTEIKMQEQFESYARHQLCFSKKLDMQLDKVINEFEEIIELHEKVRRYI